MRCCQWWQSRADQKNTGKTAGPCLQYLPSWPDSADLPHTNSQRSCASKTEAACCYHSGLHSTMRPSLWTLGDCGVPRLGGLPCCTRPVKGKYEWACCNNLQWWKQSCEQTAVTITTVTTMSKVHQAVVVNANYAFSLLLKAWKGGSERHSDQVAWWWRSQRCICRCFAKQHKIGK